MEISNLFYIIKLYYIGLLHSTRLSEIKATERWGIIWVVVKCYMERALALLATLHSMLPGRRLGWTGIWIFG